MNFSFYSAIRNFPMHRTGIAAEMMMNLPSNFFQIMLEGLTERRTQHSNERRKGPRFSLPVHVDLIPVGEQQFPMPRAVRVRDVSASGISIICDEPFTDGQTFTLQIDRLNAPRVTVTCIAQHCRRIDLHTYRIGARFHACSESQDTRPPAARLAA
jgi:hypothetical protein